MTTAGANPPPRQASIVLGRWLLRVRPAPLASVLKRLLGIRRLELATPQGVFWIDPGSYQGAVLAQHGVYEADTLAVLESTVRSGDTFVDVGANEGYFTVVASRLAGPTGRVFAVEPQQRLQDILRRNLALNHCQNVEVSALAITDEAGQAQLHLTPDMNNSASGLTQSTRYRLATQVVECVTLAEAFAARQVGEAVVKMDIESWEYEAILGSPELFRSGRVRVLILELHEAIMAARGRDPAKITAFLTECGYQAHADSFGIVWTRHE
jgi:FkbM family methyltransferase